MGCLKVMANSSKAILGGLEGVRKNVSKGSPKCHLVKLQSPVCRNSSKKSFFFLRVLEGL